jgi:PAS domain S-box-containing protein
MPAQARAGPVRPFQHFRLVAFFAGATALGILTGLLLLRVPEEPTQFTDFFWILVASVLVTGSIGFAGVFFHRLRVLGQKWRETEKYLLAIHRESQKYRALLEGAADILLIVDPETGRLREWNARARSELGLPAGDTLELSLSAVVHADDRARLDAAVREAAAAPGPASPLAGIRLAQNGGRALVADARIAGIALDDGRIVQVALRDVTLQKEMERRLQIHERLSSVGLLTAGVAHEINNPLEGIGNYLKLLEREDLASETRKRHLEQVHHGFGRIREIVRDLLRFARPTSETGQADLASVVANAHKLNSYSERFRDVRVEVAGLDRPILVVGDPGRLEQVLFNLLLNAATAMNSKGRIRVTARETTDARGAREHELVVEDDGPGILAENLERIFDPFFTTTQGTGLGLSVSYGIVQAHGGTLSAENRAEGGARFTIRLPWKDSS